MVNGGYYAQRVCIIDTPFLTTLLVWLSADTQIVSIWYCGNHNTFYERIV